MAKKRDTGKTKKEAEKKEIDVSAIKMPLVRLFLFLARLNDFLLGISYAILGVVILNSTGTLEIATEPVYIDYALLIALAVTGIIMTIGAFSSEIQIGFRSTLLFILLVDGSFAILGYRYQILYQSANIRDLLFSASTILLVASIVLILSIASGVREVSSFSREAQRLLSLQQQTYDTLRKSSLPESARETLLKLHYENQAFFSSVISAILEPVSRGESEKRMMLALFIAVISAVIQFVIIAYYGTDLLTAIGYEIALLFIVLIATWFWTERKLKVLDEFAEQLKLARKIAEEL